MNTLLIFFAIPIAVIIVSIALQKILKCPILVAGVIFAILLVVTFAAFTTEFLVFAIVYTILAFIVAILTQFFCNIIHSGCCMNQNDNNDNSVDNPNTINITGTLTKYQDSGNTANNNCDGNEANTSKPTGNFCGCYRRR